MLQCIQYKRRDDITEFVKDFDFEKSTWIVSDLKSKYEIQKQLLKRCGYFLDQSVLRASDLWKFFFRYSYPDLKIVSKGFYQILLQSFLHQYHEQLQVNEQAAKTVMLYINQLISLLHHPEGQNLIEEWFEKNPEAATSWRSWYLISRAAHKYLFLEKKVVLAEHVAALLQNETDLARFWQRPLFVDLGVEVTAVEIDLLRHISRHVDVIIFVPDSDFKSQFPFLMKPYERVLSFAHLQKRIEMKSSNDSELILHRFSSMLGEIKFVTAEVRRLIEQEGIQPTQIGIMAANIEVYWPSLRMFFEIEGIPCNKSTVTSFQMLPIFQSWMSRIQLRQKQVKTTHLEQALFYTDQQPMMPYEQFVFLFGKIYDRSELERNQEVAQLFAMDFDEYAILDQQTFTAYILKFWNGDDLTDELISLLKELVSTSSLVTELSLKDWVAYLESMLAQKEYILKEGHQQGVQVCSLMSSQSQAADFKFFLGLSEEMLSVKNRSLVSGKDIVRLYSDCDIEVTSFEESYYEWEIKWNLESSGQRHYMLMPMSHFDSSLQTPSRFFLELEGALGLDHRHLQAFPPTRLDSLQNQYSLDDVDPRIKKKMRLEFELDEDIKILWKWSTTTLSASQLENYLKCPFIFFAEKVFHLRDEEALDIDISARDRGTLIHALFKSILDHKIQSHFSEDMLSELLEDLKKESRGMEFLDDGFWQAQKKRYVKIALRFLEAEKKWQCEFPKMSPVGLEKAFQFYFDLESGKVLTEATDHSLSFKGKIDRIDGSFDGNYLIIDYKSSAAQVKDFGKWIEAGHLQLLLYMWAIEKEVIPEFGKDPHVVGSFYYVFKNFNRNYGFQLDEFEGTYFPKTKRRNLTATMSRKMELIADFEKLLHEQLNNLVKGRFLAKPKDRETCKNCKWGGLCRAPHLQ